MLRLCLNEALPNINLKISVGFKGEFLPTSDKSEAICGIKDSRRGISMVISGLGMWESDEKESEWGDGGGVGGEDHNWHFSRTLIRALYQQCSITHSKVIAHSQFHCVSVWAWWRVITIDIYIYRERERGGRESGVRDRSERQEGERRERGRQKEERERRREGGRCLTGHLANSLISLGRTPL